MKSTIFTLNPLEIPAGSSVRREAPRPVESRQENYEDLFDDRMIFADAFIDGGKLTAVGAPPLNLESEIQAATFYLNGVKIGQPTIEPKSLCAVYHFDVSASDGDQLKIEGSDYTAEATVSGNSSDFFAGRKVLLALQKDNDLSWIAYWALHHSIVSGVDSILLYDNCSQRYAAEDIVKVLERVPGIERVMVCKSGCPFGPTGGPDGIWDSSFGQLVHYEHARRFALRHAEAVLVNDIDELIGTDIGESVMDHFLSSEIPALGIQRLNVLNILRDGFTEDDLRTHEVYGYVRKSRPMLHGKYLVRPKLLSEEAQLNVHLVKNTKIRRADESKMICGNFVGVSKTWRTGSFSDRKNVKKSGKIEVEIEPLLVDSLNRVSPAWCVLVEDLISRRLLNDQVLS